jgi:hypothetical protein
MRRVSSSAQEAQIGLPNSRCALLAAMDQVVERIRRHTPAQLLGHTVQLRIGGPLMVAVEQVGRMVLCTRPDHPRARPLVFPAHFLEIVDP